MLWYICLNLAEIDGKSRQIDTMHGCYAVSNWLHHWVLPCVSASCVSTGVVAVVDASPRQRHEKNPYGGTSMCCIQLNNVQNPDVTPRKLQHTPGAHPFGNPPGPNYERIPFTTYWWRFRGVFQRCVETTLEWHSMESWLVYKEFLFWLVTMAQIIG